MVLYDWTTVHSVPEYSHISRFIRFFVERKAYSPQDNLSKRKVPNAKTEYQPLSRIFECPVKNAIRPFTVGRKNQMICDSLAGADASAVFYTMIKIAKANDLNTYKRKLPVNR